MNLFLKCEVPKGMGKTTGLQKAQLVALQILFLSKVIFGTAAGS